MCLETSPSEFVKGLNITPPYLEGMFGEPRDITEVETSYKMRHAGRVLLSYVTLGHCPPLLYPLHHQGMNLKHQ